MVHNWVGRWNMLLSHSWSHCIANVFWRYFATCQHQWHAKKLIAHQIKKNDSVLNKIYLFITESIIFIFTFTTFRLMRSSAFFRCFMSNSGAYTELQTEPFIYFTAMGVDCFNFGNHSQAQGLSSNKYLLLFTSGLNLQPPDDLIQ